MLEAEALRLSNQARFILEICEKSLVIERKKKKVMIAELIRKNYDAGMYLKKYLKYTFTHIFTIPLLSLDPVKRWKAAQAKKEKALSEDVAPVDSDSDSDLEEDAKDADYDYLLGMPMWSLTQEKIDDLLKKKGDKHAELTK